MRGTSEKLKDFQETIFATMSALATKHGAINLSQGFPDFDGPSWIKEYVQEQVVKGSNQYAPSMGLPSLRKSIIDMYQQFYGLTYDADHEVTVTTGATEGIFSTILAVINPGDEVIVFEPFYDSYVGTIKLAGGVAVPVTLHSPDFSWNEDELKSAFSAKTKMVIFNTPHNPTGKVFSQNEMQTLAKLVTDNDCYLMSDEVYEFLLYEGAKHIPSATLAGMRERTISLSSFGKTFGYTGWKLGWVAAPAEVTKAIRFVHQFSVFSVNTPVQEAAARALTRLQEYLPGFQKTYHEKRDLMYEGLLKAGYKPVKPFGSYFIMCPIDHLTDKDDIEFCKELVIEKKVGAIPPSSFYLNSNEGKRFIRFCFAKQNDTLNAAIKNLN